MAGCGIDTPRAFMIAAQVSLERGDAFVFLEGSELRFCRAGSPRPVNAWCSMINLLFK